MVQVNILTTCKSKGGNMFHIKEDLRAIKSAELLYEGLERVMKKKEFNKITVTDITKESTVSRATFYRNFDTIIDVLYWKCNQLFNRVIKDFVEQEPDLKERDSLISFVFSFWVEHVYILEVLINEGRIDIIYNSFIANASMMMDYIKERIDFPEVQYEYFVATRVGIFISIFQTWISGGKKETGDELAKIISSEYMINANNQFIF